MKKLFNLWPALALGIALIIAGCDEIKNALNVDFDTDYTEVGFTIDATAPGTYTFIDTIIVSDLEQQVKDNNGNIADIKSVEIKECIVEVVSNGRNLNAFESLEFYIKSSTQTTKKVAWIDNIADASTSESLTIANEELKNYLGEDVYILTIKGVLDEQLDPAIDLVAKIKYNVVVGPK